MIKQELNEDKRVICKIDGFVAINPFCSRFPFETWIMPLQHSCDFDSLKETDLASFGKLYKHIFTKMNKLLGNFPFNAILHTAPFRRRQKKGYWETIDQDYHWHIEIMPRLTQVAGFEWGSGFYINSIPPEAACEALKKVKL
jgi:UDPglucose--hexose-1-phosphate uridylyltransferase